MRESFMIARARSRDVAPSRASKVSARPSSWKQAVSHIVAATASVAATGAGHSWAAATATAAPTTPTPAPTSGKCRTERFSQCGS